MRRFTTDRDQDDMEMDMDMEDERPVPLQLQDSFDPRIRNWPHSHASKNHGSGDHIEEEPFLRGKGPSNLPSGSGSLQPVTLTPGWEDQPPPFDDILRASAINLGQSPPRDRFHIVYLILVIHGIGTLMPWNMFINAKSYFEDYKLNPATVGNETDYTQNFMQTMGFAAQVPNVFFNWINIFVQLGGSLKLRIVSSIAVEIVLFVGTVVLAMIDTFNTPGLFYYLTLGSVVLINMAGGVYQNSIYGIASKLDYAGAVVLGSNISGTFTASIDIIAIWLAPSKRTSAIYYFITALFVLLLCFDSYFALPLNKFYRYHEAQSAKEQEKRRQGGSQVGRSQRTPYLQIIKKCWPQCLNVFLVFFVTLLIFPAVHSDIKMSDLGFFLGSYFTPVTCFLTFNFCAMLGNLLSSWFQWPGPKYLWIPVVLRFLFVPFFIMCNYKPAGRGDRLIQPYITNDWVYWAGAVVFSITSGYYSSLAMIYAPRTVESRYSHVAGQLSAACLVSGIFAGVLTSYLPPLISNAS